jgi:hypothetical protein
VIPYENEPGIIVHRMISAVRADDVSSEPPDNRVEPRPSGDYISHFVRSITNVKGYLWSRSFQVRPEKIPVICCMETAYRYARLEGIYRIEHMSESNVDSRVDCMIRDTDRIFLSYFHTKHADKGVHE